MGALSRCIHGQAGVRRLPGLLALLAVPATALAVPAGTVIENTATASFNGGEVVFSNAVTTETVVVRTTATLELLQYAPGADGALPAPVVITRFSRDGTPSGPFEAMPAPLEPGSAEPIDLARPLSLQPGTSYRQGDPIFIRLSDRDQNLDATTAEKVMVTVAVEATGDSELLELSETGPNTGVFTGYIQSYGDSAASEAAAPANGKLGLARGVKVHAGYADPADDTDGAAVSALVDPFGVVFDSRTGRPVDGAVITLIDEATGAPAAVVGDDGVSTFPSTVTSGSTVADSGGTVYTFGPGEYRFPLTAPGTYRMQVTPPGGYRAPSTVPTATLQNLPGGPWTLDEQGSRGGPFDVDAGAPVRIDIPLDPGEAQLFLVKEANRRVAAVGDFLQYRLRLTNTSESDLADAGIIDTLPRGLRYQSGSATRDGRPIADPAISADGRTLTFPPGAIGAGGEREWRYVVEIAAGTPAGEAVNRAVATAGAGALVSNEAVAGVRIERDLLNERNVLMGQVVADDCAGGDRDETAGIAGVRIYLEDGTSVVTDVQGRFHIEGVRPGSHVVQMDLDTLAPQYEPVVCGEHSRFAGRSFSRFVDLQGGMLWRTDFHVRKRPPPQAEVGLEIDGGVDGHMATYHLSMGGGDLPLGNVRLVVSLPAGTRYLPGSSVMDDSVIGDPEKRETVLVYDLGSVDGDWERELNFLAEVEPNGEPSLLATRAFLMFDTPQGKGRTPVVETAMKRVVDEHRLSGAEGLRFPPGSNELSEQDRNVLALLADGLREHRVVSIKATGHTDNVPVRPGAATRFADNFALSVARAEAVGKHLAGLLQLPDELVVVNGLGASVPYAPNDTERGRRENRRVELHVVTETMVDASALNEAASPSNITVTVEGKWREHPLPERQTSSEQVKLVTMPEYGKADAEAARPGFEILWPPEDYVPPIPSIKIAVKHDPASRVTLLLNGRPVSALNFDGRVSNAARTVAFSRWAGVDIAKGTNVLVVETRDAEGNVTARRERIVRMSSLPVRAELVEARSRLVADGKQTPVIAVRLLDEDDRPVRPGLIGEFRVEPPHRAQQDIDDLQRSPLTGLDRGNTRYRVGDDGIALVELVPTTRTGEVQVSFPLERQTVTLRPWLHGAERDWILVGLAEGTLGHKTVSGNMQSLSAADLERGTYTDGRSALFAKGAIKGEWLLTLAYDSAKGEDERENLFGEIDPDAYYTVYGDGSAQAHDAASREKLYVRLERRQFYALFGDYTTGLTVTELARYDRSLTGFKTELGERGYSLNLFASETDQTFAKDEIRGDGTSGLYRLEHADLLINSEKVRIETRDRFRPQLVLSSRPLQRHIDYNIDYGGGTLYFRKPVPSKDEHLNPVYIVVDYETRADDASAWSWGGRGAVKLLEERVEIGGTYVSQGRENAEDTLEGLDATVDFSRRTRMKVEYAASRNGDGEDREAYLAELRHAGPALQASLYYRERETGFGLDQQSAIGSGTRLYGIDGRYHLSEQVDVLAEAFRQADLHTGANRDVLETGVAYKAERHGASIGLLSASDRYGDGTVRRSEQLTLGANRVFMDNRLNLRLGHYQSLAEDDNPDYPTRTLLGADYLLNPATSLFLEQEFTFGAQAQTRGTRLGMNNRPWTGAVIDTSLEQRTSEYGARLFAHAGMRQTWQVTERWSVDAGVDSSRTLKEPREPVPPLSPSLPPASGGTEDFTAISLGAGYRNPTWSWTTRVENRNAETQDKRGIYSAAVGEPRKGLGLSARLQLFRTESIDGVQGTQSELRLGLVRRPLGRRWTFLHRLDLAADRRSGAGTESDARKIVSNLLVNYRHDAHQISTFYGAKYTRDRIDGRTYSGYTDATGLQLRRDVGRRWDIGAQAGMLHSRNSGIRDHSYGLSVGFNPATNLWMTLGYNWAGYDDDDFSLAGYTAAGPYLKLRFKFDQASVRDAAGWFNRQ